jgi:hypothetical protein
VKRSSWSLARLHFTSHLEAELRQPKQRAHRLE